MKKLAEFSVKYPVTILMIVLAILLMGYISFERLGVDLFPDLNNPKLYILLEAGEKPPEEIEKNFTDNLESLSMRQSGVVQISSISKVGAAQITVEYAWDKDMDAAFLDLQKSINSASQNWDIDDLTISQYDPNSSPVMIVAMFNSSITDMNSLRKTAENYIRNELIRLEGVADVEISGSEEKEVLIKSTSYILEAYGLTLDDLNTQINKFNRNLSGGSIVELGTNYTIKGFSTFQELNDFKNTIVKYTQTVENDSIVKAPVYLSDVAEVSFSNAEPKNIVHINGKRCIGLSIYKENKFNTIKTVEELNEDLIKIGKALPGYEFTVVQNQGKFISTSIDEVEETAMMGIVLAVIVLFVFLRRFGVTAIISAAIPISIVATFNLMYFNNLSLNIMTLGGLALGAGMLVDNSIVVVENIFRLLEEGMPLKQAAIEGTAQVGGAITASTITTIIVFLPIVYLQGASGELFKDQAWTVAFSLISSLFVAIFLIPMLSTKFLKNIKSTSKHTFKFMKAYPKFLGRVIDNRWKVIVFSVFLLVATVFIFPFVGSEFMPQTNTSEITIGIKLPVGTELERTSGTIISIEKILMEQMGNLIETIYSQAGPSTGISNSEESFDEDNNTGSIRIQLKEHSTNSSLQAHSQIENILGNIPELEYKFTQSETPLAQILGTEDFPIIVEISGEELDVIESLTNEVHKNISNISSLVNIESSFSEGTPVIEIEINRLTTGLYNIGIQQITTQLQDKLMGKNSGSWDYDGEMNNITLKLPDVSIKQLENLIIVNGQSKYRLSELATIIKTTAPKEIYRSNQIRIGKVTAQIVGDKSLDKIVNEINTQLAKIEFPPDYKVQITGEELMRKESMSNLTFALVLSIILVYMALASQFESLVHPFTILLTIPLAGVGAILIFFIVGMSLNIMAFIGIIMLSGIAVNDSIILVDAINQLKNEGMSLKNSIILAGEKRIRPIIMTSLTTILALLPLTFGFGESASLRSPMAYAVIGGLVTSTLLTLIVIPCVYYIFESFVSKFKSSSSVIEE